jgi:hypothetical protein
MAGLSLRRNSRPAELETAIDGNSTARQIARSTKNTTRIGVERTLSAEPLNSGTLLPLNEQHRAEFNVSNFPDNCASLARSTLVYCSRVLTVIDTSAPPPGRSDLLPLKFHQAAASKPLRQPPP